MKPSIDARLASVVRSLSDIIMPALPDDASLAREQAQLAIGHLAIIRGQLDSAPAFDAQELQDMTSLAEKFLRDAGGGAQTQTAKQALTNQLKSGQGDLSTDDYFEELSTSVNNLLKACLADGTAPAINALNDHVLTHTEKRTPLDRQLFAAMGFDNELS